MESKQLGKTLEVKNGEVAKCSWMIETSKRVKVLHGSDLVESSLRLSAFTSLKSRHMATQASPSSLSTTPRCLSETSFAM
eukprot:763303-Hanusia_phi.AAC.7